MIGDGFERAESAQEGLDEMENDEKRVSGAIEEAEMNDTAQRARAAMIRVEMRGILRTDATAIIGIAARYEHRAGAQALVRTLLEAYAELMQLDPTSLDVEIEDEASSRNDSDAPPPPDGRLRLQSADSNGVLLSELLVAGGFVSSPDVVRKAFRANAVRVDDAIKSVDTRIPPGTVRIKVGDQDEREVVIAAVPA